MLASMESISSATHPKPTLRNPVPAMFLWHAGLSVLNAHPCYVYLACRTQAPQVPPSGHGQQQESVNRMVIITAVPSV
jgi:hypothetical protein